MRAIDKRPPVVRLHVLRQGFGIGLRARHGDAIVEMKLARATEVVEPIRDVAVLLDFEQDKAATNRMQSARRRIIGVPRSDWTPIHHLDD